MKKRTLESIKSEILVFEKAKAGNEPTEEKLADILKSMAKKRREAITAYEQGGRLESAAKEKEELAIIESYLPQLMNEEQIKEAVRKIITEQGLTKADFGKAMGIVMKELKGKADGGLVGRIVKEILGN